MTCDAAAVRNDHHIEGHYIVVSNVGFRGMSCGACPWNVPKPHLGQFWNFVLGQLCRALLLAHFGPSYVAQKSIGNSEGMGVNARHRKAKEVTVGEACRTVEGMMEGES